MKFRLALFASLLTPLALHAQETPPAVPGAVANVTVALTETYEAFVSESETAYVTKLTKASYGNKQLLTDLLNEGFFGESETSIKGWSLVVVDRTPLVEQEGNSFVFYAVKTGRAPVQIPDSRLELQIGSSTGAEGVSRKFANGEVVSSKSSFKVLVEFEGRQVRDSAEESYDYSFDLIGMASGKDSIVVRKLTKGDVTTEYTYNLLGAISFNPLVGRLNNNIEEFATPLEGRITFSAFRAIDITNFPYQLPEIR